MFFLCVSPFFLCFLTFCVFPPTPFVCSPHPFVCSLVCSHTPFFVFFLLSPFCVFPPSPPLTPFVCSTPPLLYVSTLFFCVLPFYMPLLIACPLLFACPSFFACPFFFACHPFVARVCVPPLSPPHPSPRTMAHQMAEIVERAVPHQYALSTRGGCECVAHVLQGLTESDPETL